MPFSKTPDFNTYGSKRISLAREVNTRPGVFATKDEDFLNCYIDPIKARIVEDKRLFVTKRAGTATFLASVQAAAVRGMYFWADEQKLFYAVNNDIYSYNLSTDVNTTLSNVLSTTSGDVGFCEYLYDTGSTVVIVSDGTTLLSIDDSNTVVTCADSDLPSPHLPYPVFLDGYLLLAKSGTADVYNSDLNDPMAWTAGNLIMSEIEGDLVTRIAKLNNYFLAFGKNSIEYFWDAAVETGSPFQRNDSVVKHVGYYSGYAEFGRQIYFVGNDVQGQLDVYVLEDLKITQVGTPVISRYLNNEAGALGQIRGNIVAISGKNFYVLYTGDLTYVLDIETRVWTRWAWKQFDNFPILHCINVKKINDYLPIFCLDQGTAELNYFSDSLYRDESTNFTVQITTDINDFDTLNRKFMHRFTLLADSPETDSNVSVQWSDDDYQTWSTAVNVNLNQDLPSLYRLGVFRQRAFRLAFTDNQPFRIQEIEVDINKGNA